MGINLKVARPREAHGMGEDVTRSDVRDQDRIGAIIEAIADLLQSASEWVRQEAEAIVREKLVAPLQRLGLTIASALAAALLAAVGAIFVAVAAFLYLAQWLTYPGALLLIGALLLVGAVALSVLKVRSMQR